MKNPQVAQVFREISAFLEMEGVPFKPRAYEKACAHCDLQQQNDVGC